MNKGGTMGHFFININLPKFKSEVPAAFFLVFSNFYWKDFSGFSNHNPLFSFWFSEVKVIWNCVMLKWRVVTKLVPAEGLSTMKGVPPFQRSVHNEICLKFVEENSETFRTIGTKT